MIGFLISISILSYLMWRWHQMKEHHDARIQQLPIRIHVNGIRGKSTVTRLIAGVLREGGFKTIAKTTGSAARIIFPDGNETPIQRKGAPTIIEQIDIIENFTSPSTEALVIECMAINPHYQRISQDQIVKGNITIITNVREDHQDVMGQSLQDIAESLSNTIPYKGLLITAEDRKDLLDQLEHNTKEKESEFFYADPTWVSDEDMKGFNYLVFRENLSIGLAIAKKFNIPHHIAIRGMRKALPDIGVVFIERTNIKGKELIWAPMFAVNDRESTIIGVEALQPYHNHDSTKIGILNNRYDRAVRATKFAEIATLDLRLDYYITFGAYETQVTDHMVKLGYPKDQIFNLGFSKNPTLEEILDQIMDLIKGDQGLLIGLVNIHTPQAELLMEFFHHLRGEKLETSELSADLRHVPESIRRQRYLISHLLSQKA